MLGQWPVQLHLVSPAAPYWNKADVLIAASCVPVAFGDFQNRLLKGRRIVIACPKLDRTEGYLEKLTDILRHNDISSVTVAHMEVPCCPVWWPWWKEPGRLGQSNTIQKDKDRHPGSVLEEK